MSIKFKDINKRNHTYYFFNEIINIENFDTNIIKIYEKSYENILIYCIGYVTIKDSIYLEINSVNASYLIMDTLKKLIKISI